MNKDDFWEGVERSAALVKNLPAWTSAGLVLSNNFNGSEEKKMKTFAIAFVDSDGELLLLKVNGENKYDTLKAFLSKHFPDSDADLAPLTSEEDLIDWVYDCEQSVDIIEV